MGLGKKFKKLAKKADPTSSVKNVVSKFDPTSKEGLANIATGGAYGTTKAVTNVITDEAKKYDPTSLEGRQNIAGVLVGGASMGAIGTAGGVAASGSDGNKIIDKLKPKTPEDPSATESEKQSAKIAAKEYDFARQLDFVKHEYANRIAALDSNQKQGYIEGQANIGAQNQLGQLSGQVQSGLAQAGIDPSSGRATSTMTNLQTAGGESAGRSQSESAFALKSAALEGQNNRIAMALGEKTKAVAGLQDIARGANELAGAKAINKFNSKAALNNAIGTGAGMAIQGYAGRDKE